MGYVPHFRTEEAFIEAPAGSITIHVLRENKRPIGFAPWPEEPKPKKRKRKKEKK